MGTGGPASPAPDGSLAGGAPAAPLRVAIIGSGGMAYTRASHLAHDPRANLTCVSSRNPVTGRALASRYGVEYAEGWPEVVQRDPVDAVFVCTHNDSHAPMARAALAAGKHVFVEYPLALSLADADQLIELAGRQGRALHVGHDQAYAGWHLGLRDAAAALGRLLALNSLLAT